MKSLHFYPNSANICLNNAKIMDSIMMNTFTHLIECSENMEQRKLANLLHKALLSNLGWVQL